VYVSGLARELRQLGHEVWIAAPYEGEGEKHDEYEGIPVYRYPADTIPRKHSGDAPPKTQIPASVGLLAGWVKKIHPDLVHFHSWTSGAGEPHLRRIHADGTPVYLTIHTPSAFCVRGTMLRWEQTVCDGQMRPVRCSACYFQKRGLPKPLAWMAAVAAAMLPLAGAVLPGRLGTAAGLPRSLRLRRRQLEDTWKICRQVVAVCHWVEDALLENGCPRDKLRLSRQGCDTPESKTALPSGEVRPMKRIGFLGRLDPVKGVIILINAVKRLPRSLPIEVELKGIPQSEDYLRALKEMIRDDPRLRLVEPSPPNLVHAWLKSLDLLVVPSLWLETGPLVIYEAFAAGVPVVGARRGGIAELVEEDVNGLLFEPGSEEDLAQVLQLACQTPELVHQIRQRIGRVRSMCDVARDMDCMYRETLPAPPR
jgi:glycosyltransferase involved in cell wall biosynthesis